MTDIKNDLTAYQTPNTVRSLFEFAITLYGTLIFIYAGYILWAGANYLLYGLVTMVTSLFFIRMFTIQHDCSHESMFKSLFLNRLVGRLCILITTVPYRSWKAEHDSHHDHVVDIEKIGLGDVSLWTLEKYESKGKVQQTLYRIYRNPLFLLVIAPFLYFFLRNRVPAIYDRKIIMSVVLTNIVLLVMYLILVYYLGFWAVFFSMIIPAYIAGIIGVGLFYVQHQFPDARWFTTQEWSHVQASIEGSSLLVLPQPLEWFTYNIGYHHIHHVDSGVPAYRLKQCYQEVEAVGKKRPLTLMEILSSFRLRLWSREQNKLIGIN